MANSVTGKIAHIGQTEYKQSKDGSKTFKRREIVIDATRYNPYTGERMFDNYPALEFSGDKCDELDGYKVGQLVTVSFDLSGMKYQDKTTGETKYFTSVRAYKIEAKGAQASEQQPVQQPQAAPQPQMQQPPYQQDPFANYGGGYQPTGNIPF